MKNIYFLIAFLSTALLSVNAFAHEPSNTNELSGKTFSGLNTEAGRTVLSFHQALSNGQAERVMSALSPDVIILEGSRIERSAEEYRQHHLQADMRFSSAVETTTIEHYVRVYGDHHKHAHSAQWLWFRLQKKNAYRLANDAADILQHCVLCATLLK